MPQKNKTKLDVSILVPFLETNNFIKSFFLLIFLLQSQQKKTIDKKSSLYIISFFFIFWCQSLRLKLKNGKSEIKNFTKSK